MCNEVHPRAAATSGSRIGHMTSPFLFRPEIVDANSRRAAIECLRAARVTLPTWSELADPGLIPAAIASSLKSVGPDEPNGKNLWRVHWFNDADAQGSSVRARPRGAAGGADRREGADRRPARPALSHDRRAQGACRLCVSGAAPGDRPVRSEARPRGLAIHRKLLPRRRRHIAHSRLPRRCRAAGRHEPGALRMAAGMGVRSRRHHPHAGNREQRQGNLRQVRRARARQGQRHSQPVLRVRQLSDPLSLHRRCIRSCVLASAKARNPGIGWRRSCRRPARPEQSRPATI